MEGTSLLDHQLSEVQMLGAKAITFLPFPWTIENSSLFAYLLYYLDFVLESKVAFPMVILEDYLLPCDLWGFYMIIFVQVWFLGLLSPQFYSLQSIGISLVLFLSNRNRKSTRMATKWIFLLIKVWLNPHGVNMWFFTLGLKVEKLPSGH